MEQQMGYLQNWAPLLSGPSPHVRCAPFCVSYVICMRSFHNRCAVLLPSNSRQRDQLAPYPPLNVSCLRFWYKFDSVFQKCIPKTSLTPTPFHLTSELCGCEFVLQANNFHALHTTPSMTLISCLLLNPSISWSCRLCRLSAGHRVYLGADAPWDYVSRRCQHV